MTIQYSTKFAKANTECFPTGSILYTHREKHTKPDRTDSEIERVNEKISVLREGEFVRGSDSGLEVRTLGLHVAEGWMKLWKRGLAWDGGCSGDGLI